ncbi:MAG TPA: GreA/GreB family elongation factor [Woeseiaceae bacterium]|nr:GreA/GreB family elongation factor [Woeseiaceae bacterium]
MSKAFTKEEPGDDPVIVPERPPLPPGVPNYVTERGKALLEEEHRRLTEERARLKAQAPGDREEEHNKALAVVNRRLAELAERIATARVVQPPENPDAVVRFGATVTLRRRKPGGEEETRRITLVGVDEAGESPELVSFTAPIARALLGHRAGETVTYPAHGGDEALEILEVTYPTSRG